MGNFGAHKHVSGINKMKKTWKIKFTSPPFLVVAILTAALTQTTSAQQVGDMYKKCKFWSLSGFPTKLEFNKSNYGAFQCNEVFRSYRMSGKVHCQLLDQEMSGFIPPFDGYAFNAPTNDALVKSFLSYAEDNPRDWEKNVYAVLWKFTGPFKCH